MLDMLKYKKYIEYSQIQETQHASPNTQNKTHRFKYKKVSTNSQIQETDAMPKSVIFEGSKIIYSMIYSIKRPFLGNFLKFSNPG